jgi:hypothetical protein
MADYISMIVCTHSGGNDAGLQQQLREIMVEVWATRGIVAAIPLIEAGRCGMLTTWSSKGDFEAWHGKRSYRRLKQTLSGLVPEQLQAFDCTADKCEKQISCSSETSNCAGG